MRAGTHAFITREPHRRDRVNLIWSPLYGKPGILADYTNSTDGTRMIADPDMLLSGTGATSATAAAAVEGGLFIAVVTGNTNSMFLSPHTLTNNSPWAEFTWGTDQEVEAEWLFQIDAALTDRVVKCGLALTNTGDATTDDDQVGLMATSDAVLDTITSIAGTDVAVAGAGGTKVASQYCHLAIKFNQHGKARIWVDGQERDVNAHFGGDVGAGNVVDLIPFYGTLEATSGAADPKINCVKCAISRALGA